MKGKTFYSAYLFLLIAAQALADPITKDAARKYLEKNGACVFAAAYIVTKTTGAWTRQSEAVGAVKTGFRGNQRSNAMPVLCVWNGVLNKGTIHEKEGCTLGQLDLEVGEYFGLDRPAYPIGFPDRRSVNKPMMKDGPCTKETIASLLNGKMFYSESSVWDAAFKAAEAYSLSSKRGIIEVELQPILDSLSVSSVLPTSDLKRNIAMEEKSSLQKTKNGSSK